MFGIRKKESGYVLSKLQAAEEKIRLLIDRTNPYTKRDEKLREIMRLVPEVQGLIFEAHQEINKIKLQMAEIEKSNKQIAEKL